MPQAVHILVVREADLVACMVVVAAYMAAVSTVASMGAAYMAVASTVASMGAAYMAVASMAAVCMAAAASDVAYYGSYSRGLHIGVSRSSSTCYCSDNMARVFSFSYYFCLIV